MPSMNFVADLKKLGLNDKEAAAYLAALALGPSTVQRIARKANVARATTYLVLEALAKLGLITKYIQGNKTLFVAESPRQLERLLDRRQEIIDGERTDLKDLMPKLLAFMQAQDGQALVRYYEGMEGLKSIRAEITMQSKPGELWRQIAPVDYMQAAFGKEDFTYVKQRKAKRIQSRSIIATKSSELKKELMMTAEKRWAERKFIDPKRYTSASGATFFTDKIVITTYAGKLGGAIIESKSVAKMMAELFDLLWNSLE